MAGRGASRLALGCCQIAAIHDGLEVVGAFHFPDSIEFHKIGLDRNAGKVCGKQLSGAEQFFAVMVGFGCFVPFEMGHAAVGGAVGVTDDQDAVGLVQVDGHADLFEDEVPFEVVARGGERFGSSGDGNHVGTLDALLLQELSHRRADAVIEAAEHGRVGHVGAGGRVEMEDLLHFAMSFSIYHPAR